MNQRLKKFSIAGLRWTLSRLVLLESVRFAFRDRLRDAPKRQNRGGAE